MMAFNLKVSIILHIPDNERVWIESQSSHNSCVMVSGEGRLTLTWLSWFNSKTAVPIGLPCHNPPGSGIQWHRSLWWITLVQRQQINTKRKTPHKNSSIPLRKVCMEETVTLWGIQVQLAPLKTHHVIFCGDCGAMLSPTVSKGREHSYSRYLLWCMLRFKRHTVGIKLGQISLRIFLKKQYLQRTVVQGQDLGSG